MMLEKGICYMLISIMRIQRNSVYQDLSDKAVLLVRGLLLFPLDSEILSIPEALLAQFMKEEEGLKTYDFYLKDILRRKPHILSEEGEELLADAGEMASSPDNIYSKFNNADIKFPEIKDENGDTVRITHGRFIQLLESTDRRVRRMHLKAYTQSLIPGIYI